MSWAAHNPEGWDDIELEAVINYLTDITPIPLNYEVVAKGVVRDLAWSLRDDMEVVFHHLVEQLPHKYLGDAEADYHASRIDAATTIGDYDRLDSLGGG